LSKQAYYFSESSLEEANEDSDESFQISYSSYLCKQTSPERANLNLSEEIHNNYKSIISSEQNQYNYSG
jgi:hypothetical protein